MKWKERKGRGQKRSCEGPAEGVPGKEGLHGQESRERFPSIPPPAASDNPIPHAAHGWWGDRDLGKLSGHCLGDREGSPSLLGN